jgi:hypothetical protein
MVASKYSRELQYRAAGWQGQRLNPPQRRSYGEFVALCHMLWAATHVLYISMSKELPDYDVVADAVNRAGLESSAAECHGGLTALLCTVENLNPAQWLALYVSAEKAKELPQDVLAVLGEMFKATAEQLDDADFDFQLLLPTDDSILDARVEAISDWAQGYLMGLGLGGVADVANLPGDLPELVQDFIKISRADSLSLDDEEASENAFAEIVEYMRVGALMFRQEMKSLHTAGKDNPKQLH